MLATDLGHPAIPNGAVDSFARLFVGRAARCPRFVFAQMWRRRRAQPLTRPELVNPIVREFLAEA